MSKPILYGTDLSIYASSAKVALAYKKIPYDFVPPPGGYGSAEYKSIVPTGKIPALVLQDEDGYSIAESAVVLEFINEYWGKEHGYPDLLTGDPKTNANIRFVCRINDLYAEPALRALFPHMKSSIRDAGFVQEKLEAFYKQLDILETYCHTVGPHFFGDKFTYADCVIPTVLELGNLMIKELTGSGIDGSRYPKLIVMHGAASVHEAAGAVVSTIHDNTVAWLDKVRPM
jgi:glutathione S-transferase